MADPAEFADILDKLQELAGSDPKRQSQVAELRKLAVKKFYPQGATKMPEEPFSLKAAKAMGPVTDYVSAIDRKIGEHQAQASKEMSEFASGGPTAADTKDYMSLQRFNLGKLGHLAGAAGSYLMTPFAWAEAGLGDPLHEPRAPTFAGQAGQALRGGIRAPFDAVPTMLATAPQLPGIKQGLQSTLGPTSPDDLSKILPVAAPVLFGAARSAGGMIGETLRSQPLPDTYAGADMGLLAQRLPQARVPEGLSLEQGQAPQPFSLEKPQPLGAKLVNTEARGTPEVTSRMTPGGKLTLAEQRSPQAAQPQAQGSPWTPAQPRPGSVAGTRGWHSRIAAAGFRDVREAVEAIIRDTDLDWNRLQMLRPKDIEALYEVRDNLQARAVDNRLTRQSVERATPQRQQPPTPIQRQQQTPLTPTTNPYTQIDVDPGYARNPYSQIDPGAVAPKIPRVVKPNEPSGAPAPQPGYELTSGGVGLQGPVPPVTAGAGLTISAPPEGVPPASGPPAAGGSAPVPAAPTVPMPAALPGAALIAPETKREVPAPQAAAPAPQPVAAPPAPPEALSSLRLAMEAYFREQGDDSLAEQMKTADEATLRENIKMEEQARSPGEVEADLRRLMLGEEEKPRVPAQAVKPGEAVAGRGALSEQKPKMVGAKERRAAQTAKLEELGYPESEVKRLNSTKSLSIANQLRDWIVKNEIPYGDEQIPGKIVEMVKEAELRKAEAAQAEAEGAPVKTGGRRRSGKQSGELYIPSAKDVTDAVRRLVATFGLDEAFRRAPDLDEGLPEALHQAEAQKLANALGIRMPQEQPVGPSGGLPPVGGTPGAPGLPVPPQGKREGSPLKWISQAVRHHVEALASYSPELFHKVRGYVNLEEQFSGNYLRDLELQLRKLTKEEAQGLTPAIMERREPAKTPAQQGLVDWWQKYTKETVLKDIKESGSRVVQRMSAEELPDPLPKDWVVKKTDKPGEFIVIRDIQELDNHFPMRGSKEFYEKMREEDPATKAALETEMMLQGLPPEMMKEKLEQYRSPPVKPLTPSVERPRTFSLPDKFREQDVPTTLKDYFRDVARTRALNEVFRFFEKETGDVRAPDSAWSPQGDLGDIIGGMRPGESEAAIRIARDIIGNDPAKWSSTARGGEKLVSMLGEVNAVRLYGARLTTSAVQFTQHAMTNAMTGENIFAKAGMEVARHPLKVYDEALRAGAVEPIHEFTKVVGQVESDATVPGARPLRALGDAAMTPMALSDMTGRLVAFEARKAFAIKLKEQLNAEGLLGKWKQGVARTNLEFMDFTPEQIARFKKGDLSTRELNMLGQRMVEATQGKVNQALRMHAVSGTWGKLFSQGSNFAVENFRNSTLASRQLFRAGNPIPAVRMAAGAALVGAPILALKQWLRPPQPGDKNDAEDYMHAGGLGGIAGDYIHAAFFEDDRQGAAKYMQRLTSPQFLDLLASFGKGVKDQFKNIPPEKRLDAFVDFIHDIAPTEDEFSRLLHRVTGSKQRDKEDALRRARGMGMGLPQPGRLPGLGLPK